MKTITTVAERKVEVKTDGNLWGFRAGDIIYFEEPRSKDEPESLKIEGFEIGGRGIFATKTGESESVRITSPENIILLERLDMKFKIGDKVKGREGNIVGISGEVIVIDLTIKANYFLVKFDHWDKGHEARVWWIDPWFPKKYKVRSENYWWCREEDLELIKNPQKQEA